MKMLSSAATQALSVPSPAPSRRQSRSMWRLAYALGIALVGALNTLSFAPTPHGGWLQIIIFSLGCALMMRTRTVREALLVGGLFGFGQFISGVYWLYISMHTYGAISAVPALAALILVALYLAIYPALAAGLWRICTPHEIAVATSTPISASFNWRSSLVFASAWTLAEWLRGTVFTGFPWLALGYAQVDGPLAGYAPLVGVYGISWLLAWLCALLVQTCAHFIGWGEARTPTSLALQMRPNCDLQHVGVRTSLQSIRFATGIAPLLAICTLIAGGIGATKLSWTTAHGSPLNVRLLQGNVAQEQKFQEDNLEAIFTRYQQLITARAADLIITPETALPLLISQAPTSFAVALSQFTSHSNSAILLGAVGTTPTATGELGVTNSLFGLLPHTDGLYQYNKHHLVPFGEFVPWGFRWFISAMKIPLTDFTRGSLQQSITHPFSVREQSLALSICYEDIFGEEIARALRQAPKPANLLINATNLGWFGNTIALDQHLQMARMRALETGRPVLRATNTGATAAIDYDGRVLARFPAFTIGALNVQVQGRNGFTPYIRYGNLPTLLISLVIILGSLFYLKTCLSSSQKAMI